jgi:multiple sugar transport system permease protein
VNSSAAPSNARFAARPGRRLGRLAVDSALILVAAVVVVWMAFPFYWTVLNSIKPATDTFGDKWLPWVQFDPTLATWRRVFDIREVRRSLANSAIIGIGGASLAIVVGTPAAYALSRFRFERPGNAGLLNWFLSQRVMPPVIFAPPFFLICRALGLLDSLFALVVLAGTFNISFAVMIMSQMFRDVPIELEEAAQIDGASQWEIFTRIVLPLVRPGLIAAWLIALAACWNELFFALVIATKNAIPLTVLIVGQSGTRGIDFPAASTMALFMLTPPTLIALFCQRYIVRGLSLGAVRG